ncbi:Unknown protein sequence [Pseudomonas coronafaciens pv. oryzae]|nr:Unknown protein sequence [Pseudomonas coronafaciens pv. oryzae]
MKNTRQIHHAAPPSWFSRTPSACSKGAPFFEQGAEGQ